MIKNFIIISIICFFVIACGKKGDPEYVEPKKNVKKNIILINKA
tara:strand:+ start:5067 stop:5198 length:132 start_codon:yes stop_codon:yes gene_type:complete